MPVRAGWWGLARHFHCLPEILMRSLPVRAGWWGLARHFHCLLKILTRSLPVRAGWWGLARHFHYLPEILAAFAWSAPAGFSHFLPFFYVFFLTLLLTDRAFRDDARCRSKYGKYWAEYTRAVPYKMVPLLF